MKAARVRPKCGAWLSDESEDPALFLGLGPIARLRLAT
jgi:hypothetical protein